MGGTYLADTYPGTTQAEALEALRAKFRADGYTDSEEWGEDDDDPTPWPDPFSKSIVQVLDDAVADMAVDWMRGWAEQHAPAGVDPDDKWGPWMAFPLKSGGWHVFGWVNT